MPQKWKTVRVFISSTFKDMQAEREELVRFVFPKLRVDLIRYKIHLIDVDLRWGVREDQDASFVCRSIIDECHPRILCMLGGRYGWIPIGAKHSITEDEVRYGVLDRAEKNKHAFFYFRKHQATADMVEERPGEFLEPTGSIKLGLLNSLKKSIINAGFKPFVYDANWDEEAKRLTGLTEFREQVYTDLLGSITQEYDEQPGNATHDYQEEQWLTEAYIEERTQRFVLGSRQHIYEEFYKYIKTRSSEEGYICLYGGPGLGKSSLLAFLVKNCRNDSQLPSLILSQFIEASSRSTDIHFTLRRFCHELLLDSDLDIEIPEDSNKLHLAFWQILSHHCKNRDLVIVLDSVEEMSQINPSGRYWWLPKTLPKGAIVLLSTTPDALEEIKETLQPICVREINPLKEKDKNEIINNYFKRYGKSMDTSQINYLASKEDTGKPLYLLAALEELRTLGGYNEISHCIEQLPPTVSGLFKWIIKRLEGDQIFRDEKFKAIGKDLVPKFMALLGVARKGLSIKELKQLLAPAKGEDKDLNLSDPMGNVAALMYLLRPYLISRGEYFTFYHNQFFNALQSCYLDFNAKQEFVHSKLATFFMRQRYTSHEDKMPNARKLTELPYHLLKSRNWKAIEKVLFDPIFLKTKISAGLIVSLGTDLMSTADQAQSDKSIPTENYILQHLDLLARCLGDGSQKIDADPSSIVPQLYFELQKYHHPKTKDLLDRLETIQKDAQWIKSVAKHGLPETRYCAQTAFYENFNYGLSFSNTGEEVVYAGTNGIITRWNWREAGAGSSTLPVELDGIIRYGGMVSSSRFLLGTKRDVWVLKAKNIWKDDLPFALWEKIYTVEAGYEITNISTSKNQGIGLICCCRDDEAYLAKYSSKQDNIEERWAIPIPDPGNLINHVGLSDNNNSKAICFWKGEILFSSGAQVFAHSGGVYHSQFINNGKILLSCGEDGSCALWSDRGSLLSRFELLHGSAECLTYCSKNKTLYVGHRSGHISIISVDQNNFTKAKLSSFMPGVAGWVLDIEVSNCGKWLAVAGRNGIIRLFSTNELSTIQGHAVQTIYFKPISVIDVVRERMGCLFMDGKTRLCSTLNTSDSKFLPLRCKCAIADCENNIIFVTAENNLSILKLDTGEPIITHKIDSKDQIALALCNSGGKKLAALDKERIVIYEFSEDLSQCKTLGKIDILDFFPTGKKRLPWPRRNIPILFIDNSRYLALPLEQEILLKPSKDRDIPVPDLHHKLAIFNVSDGSLSQTINYEGICTCLEYSSLSSKLLLGTGSHHAYVDLGKQKDITTIGVAGLTNGVLVIDFKKQTKTNLVIPTVTDGGVTDMSITQDSELLAVSFSSGRIRLADLAQGSWIASVNLANPALGLKFSQTENRLLVSDDGVETALTPVVHEFEVYR